MSATPVRPSNLAPDLLARHAPLLPTVVVASYKGGTSKTALAVAIAERLALAGLRVLLMTCDTQEDARHRLGVDPNEDPIARRDYGAGSVTVAGIRGQKAIDVLYRKGPQMLGAGGFDMAVLDTPPEVQGGSLPGVYLVATLDGADAARNLITMLRRTPENTAIILVRIGREARADWAQNVIAIGQAIGRRLDYYDDPLVPAKRIKDAHDEGRSVWTLPRRGHTLAFLNAVDTIARIAWQRVYMEQPWPPPPPVADSAPYIPGWDDDET